jgi:hypothetical protein
MSLCSCVWMFWFLSLQHQCDAVVGFIFHKNLAGFFRRMSLAQRRCLYRSRRRLARRFLGPSQAIDEHHPSPPSQRVFEKSWFSTIDVFFNEVLEKAFQFFSVAVSARKHFEGLKTTRTGVLRPHDLDGPPSLTRSSPQRS